MPGSDPPSTPKDRDCAALARAALFPHRVSRDGHRPTMFPALEALTKLRVESMVSNPDVSHANFFPQRVIVVRPVAGNYAPDELQWNGQPDIDDATATFDLIPRMITVKCMECSGMTLPATMPKDVNSFVRPSQFGLTRQDRGEGNEKNREIVLCTNRLLQKDYDEGTIKRLEFPQKSLAAVEEALAREVTKMRDSLKVDRGEIQEGGISKAHSEVVTALAAECYYNQHGKEVKKGSQLQAGYSMLPSPLQHWARNRCVRSVAGKAVEREVDNAKKAKSLLDNAMKDIMT
eukprot:CAMPEP_0197721728 /NCGR_PEP_ID=MMETSP1434-20131217/4686_1 /TAXON_ID=265543 /ORGANISM="Minutocellus polymorphus, Strain CCMP3303" /LENGTH=289 /DNA_ID=CAMNT_0043306787 /DNA_START=40 /DNA_END=909 /DNA_ORIENTATION=+